MKKKYSIFSLIKNALSGHENWQRAWRDPEPKKEYDVIIIGGGGHICSSLAEGFALAGASLSIVDLRLEKALKISKTLSSKYGTKAIYIEADAGKENSLKNALNRKYTIPFLFDVGTKHH